MEPNFDRELPFPKPPFRLGTTSYIYPDDILPNAAQLIGWVDDIEIVLFEATPEYPLPGPEVFRTLREWADRCGISYTVHLPLDLVLASVDAGARKRSVELARQTIDVARVLDPWGYVIHIEHGEGWPGSWAEWQRLAQTSLIELLGEVGEPERLCLENTESVPPEQTFSLAQRLDVSVCLDAGHLWKTGLEATSYLDAILPRSRVVHLHGWDGERDHRSLAEMSEDRLKPVITRLSRPLYRGVVTLEIFNEKDLLASWECLAKLSQRD